ncbi:MAG TPA: YajQ family cyclic di-GMP-binding protein [Actinomycetota bacterium]|nr:YajQ family cyclic di-GMP-binding protein [Actinomycetota bacterium]
MAQFSFDIISEIDKAELANALDQARKEIGQRFDFKNTQTEIKHEEETLEIRANSEGRVEAALDVLKEKMVRRDISLKALDVGKIEPGASSSYKLGIKLVHGISDEKGRAINKFIKASGTKVQSQIQGGQLRVTSKTKDDLQNVIKLLRDEDFGIPLQFTNYR